MPRIILMVIDDDILLHIVKRVNDENKERFMKKALTWVIEQVDRAIEIKKESLQQRKPGALIAGEPKLIWIEMMNKMNGVSKILKMRGKFNELMNNIMANREQHYVINVNRIMDDSSYFDQFNQINEHGITRFWQQIDYHMELFDKKRISLLPERTETRDYLKSRNAQVEEFHQDVPSTTHEDYYC